MNFWKYVLMSSFMKTEKVNQNRFCLDENGSSMELVQLWIDMQFPTTIVTKRAKINTKHEKHKQKTIKIKTNKSLQETRRFDSQKKSCYND